MKITAEDAEAFRRACQEAGEREPSVEEARHVLSNLVLLMESFHGWLVGGGSVSLNRNGPQDMQ